MRKKVKISQISDFFIRCLLGQHGHEKFLLDFVNSFMADSGLGTFAAVAILNPYNLKKHKDSHQTIVDVKAVTDSGEVVIIEIQASSEIHFANRVLYYWAENYVRLENKRIKYGALKSVISINVINFTIDFEYDLPHTTYMIYCKETGRLLSNKLIIHFLELPKFIDKVSSKALSAWCKYLTSKNLKEDKMSIIKDNPVLEDAIDYYDKFSLDKDLVDEYTKHEMYIKKQNTMIDDAKEKGIEQGIEQGRIEVAKNLLKNDIDIEVIVASTGLTKKRILEIKSSI